MPRPRHHCLAASLCAAALALSACTGAPVVPAAQPQAAPLSSLRPSLGQYPHEGGDYLRQGALAQRLRALLGPERYAVLLANLQVSGPLSAEGELWFITGNRQHQGGAEQAAVVIDPARDALRVWLLHAGRAQEFTDPPDAHIPWPADVRTMLGNARQL